MADPIEGYDKWADELAGQYDQLRAQDVHSAFLSLLPTGQDRVALDVGAGSGRDAAWLCELGFEVVAVEPARRMRENGQAAHPDRRIRWLDDRLPALSATHRLGLTFDLILLSAVFMHLRAEDRSRAFRKIATLLKPGGILLMGFAKQAFRHLMADGIAGQDLRFGATFTGGRARAVMSALADARTNIVRMPANFTCYPNSDRQVFKATSSRTPRIKEELVLDASTLRGLGVIEVPGPIWRTLQRLGSWVEPVLVTEWARLIQRFAERRGRTVAVGEAESALRWLDPARDTGFARDVARRIIERGEPVYCAWTGGRLTLQNFDIDHCLPWTAGPCGDLWNLLPARASVNRHQKRDRLPSAEALARARGRIQAWWGQAWESDAALADRFWREASAALPICDARSLDDVFAGLDWRRLRLRQDQQVPEWAGTTSPTDAVIQGDA